MRGERLRLCLLSERLAIPQIEVACIIERASRRGSGGIGRRASLRSWWLKGRRGSSPFFRKLLSWMLGNT
jgi:hypothetical protein